MSRIYTIGHSTRTLDELIARLQAFGISILVDIRTIPRSRHNPQFNSDTLSAALRRRGIRYEHLEKLGGLRRARKDSPNTAWRNTSFRGFADYMSTADFEAGLEELHALLAKGTVALMCAEAVPWRCHRSMVADALTARGVEVEHIVGSARPSPHRLTSFATVIGRHVSYGGDGVTGVSLPTRAPFHLEATVRALQRRPTNRVDVWDEDRYLRALTTVDGITLVEVANRGTIDLPDVHFSILSGDPGAAARAELEATLRRVLGLDLDPEALQRMAESLRALRPVALALRGMRPPRFAGLFEAFANVVPFQQLSLDAGVAIVGRLVERFGETLEHVGRRYYAFPAAEALAGARLAKIRECGLSARKAETLHNVARAIASGELDEAEVSSLPTDAALRKLCDLPGIGPWSAALVLLRGLGRLDVFPPGDVGAENRLESLLNLRTRESLARVIARFGIFRGYLYFCALGGSLLAKGLIHAAPTTSRPISPARAGNHMRR